MDRNQRVKVSKNGISRTHTKMPENSLLITSVIYKFFMALWKQINFHISFLAAVNYFDERDKWLTKQSENKPKKTPLGVVDGKGKSRNNNKKKSNKNPPKGSNVNKTKKKKN